MSRLRIHSPGRASLLACALVVAGFPVTARAQNAGPAVAQAAGLPANFDPSDVYFQGWLLSRDAESLEAEGKHVEALEKLQRAQTLFDSVAAYHPDWKPSMVKGRREKDQDRIGVLTPLAREENTRKNQAVAELEGGVIGGTPGSPAAPRPPAETLETRRIAELQDRIRELETGLSPDNRDSNASDRNASRVRDIERQRDLARAELKQANDELADLRRRQSAAPVQEEMRGLTQRLQQAEREKAALSQALEKSQQDTREARTQAEALNVERGRLAQKVADLERNLEQERQIQNEVIAGQQKQLRTFQDALREKNDDLARANQRIAGLEQQLTEFKATFDELSGERDNLLRERNQMAELLKLNEGSQIQQLIDQNMGLAKQLREANETVERLNRSHNSTQDELIEAMRDLAIAKESINAFKRERTAQEQRMAELERRLRTEAAALSARNADPAEVETLRSIIQKQLRIQGRQRQATELLIQAVEDKAEDDNTLKEAIDLVKGAELVLSPAELDLVKDRAVDGEFVSPVRRSPSEVDASLAELEQSNRPFIEASTRAFVSERFQSSRELFEMVLDRNPGDTSTMCKLGVVHLRLSDPAEAARVFRNATIIESGNPYAHRMLGYSLMLAGDYMGAREAVKRSVELAPTHAEGRVVLGKICFDLGDEAEAENEFKAAIGFDDTLPDPHFNLAFLYAKQGKKQHGTEHYRHALERGAAPDLELEQRLAK